MHDELRNHAEEEVLDQSKGKAEIRPVMAHLHDLQTVAVEVDLAIEVLLMKRLHGDLMPAIVAVSVLLLVERQVVFDGLVWQLGLLVLSGSKLRREDPEGREDREIHEQGEKEPCLEASTQTPGEVGGNANEERDEQRIREVVGAGSFCGEGSIGNGRILLRTQNQLPISPFYGSMAGGGNLVVVW